MNKAVIIITGSPSAKNKFDEIAKKTCYVWGANHRNSLTETSKRFRWKGERNEEFYEYLGKQSRLVNEYFDFERGYTLDLIEKFTQDDSEFKVLPINGENKVFTKWLLVLHGVSPELIEMLKEQCGAYQIHVTSHDLKTNVDIHDLTYYEDDLSFEDDINNLINSLMGEKGGVRNEF